MLLLHTSAVVICSIVLFTMAHAEYNCNKNVPKNTQSHLIEAINTRRQKLRLKPIE
ncbi:hypothetical protein OSTOST_10795, partial [Ostertagia ostertagi]